MEFLEIHHNEGDIAMSVAKSQEIFVFCDIYKKNILLKIPEKGDAKRVGGLLAILSIHGNPKHESLFYLDANYRVRGCEYPAIIESETISTHPARLLAKKGLTLEQLVSCFGNKSKTAVSNFTKFIVQTLIRNNSYLIESDLINGDTVRDHIELLFSEQGISLTLIRREEEDKVTGIYPTVFDLESKKFLTEGVNLKIPYFENLVKDIMKEKDNFYSLQNELSKMIYSYTKLKEILSTTSSSIKDTELARDISIDLPVLTILTKMAENEGIDIKTKVEFNGIGRALRSF